MRKACYIVEDFHHFASDPVNVHEYLIMKLRDLKCENVVNYSTSYNLTFFN